MNYGEFCTILNRHIFEGEKKELLRRLAVSPERFIGLFRPTKPHAKILQHLLQSHEIRMGDAFEEIIENILESAVGCEILPKSVGNNKGQQLLLDIYFKKEDKFYFIEQKIRDDHDSTKKAGQISNFKAKAKILYSMYDSNLVGIMYFIDPDFSKNKQYYTEKLEKLGNSYGIKLHLLYGKDLFEFFGIPEYWDNILEWLRQWKDNLPDLPEVNFDATPEESMEEIKDLELKVWRKILDNDKLWQEGIIQTIFGEGITLRMLLEFFGSKQEEPYKQFKHMLERRLREYYGG